jgi:type I restriction enzyme S subunit
MSKKLNKNVPALRFSEFEGGWEVSTIEEIASVSSGGTPSRTEPSFWDGDIPWVTTGEMSQTEIFDTTEKITQKGLENSSAKLFKKNTLLIAMYGQGKTRGQVSILRIEATTNQACAAITLKDNCNSEFIYHFLSGEYDRLRLLSNDGSQKNLSAGLIKQYKILLPSIAEQEKIASFLGTIDTRLTQLRRKRELLQTYKRGVMQKIFSQEIRFKGAIGSDFPEWEKKKLEEVTSFSKGKGISKDDLVESGSLKCIRYAELYTLYDEVIDHVISSTNLESDNLVLSMENDVIIPASGESAIDIAKAACVTINGVALGGDLNILRTAINGIFLAHYLNHYKKYEIASLAQGKTVVHLYSSKLKNIQIEIPTKKEQEKIADFLTAIDRKIEAVSRSIGLVEQFKKGLLQKMFV